MPVRRNNREYGYTYYRADGTCSAGAGEQGRRRPASRSSVGFGSDRRCQGREPDVSSVDAVVTGAGGFIGGHLVGACSPTARRCAASTSSRSTSGTRSTPDAESRAARRLPARDGAGRAVDGARCLNLAADMGGMGFIENNKAAVHAVRAHHHPRAGGGPGGRRRPVLLLVVGLRLRRRAPDQPEVIPLEEEDAYPAQPEDGYGWEKLFSERMCRHFLRGLRLDDPGRPLPQHLRRTRAPGRAAARRRRRRSAARWPRR